MSPAHLDEWKRRTPLRRLGKVDEVADCVLSAIRNDYLTGKVVELDGGLAV